MPRLLPLAVCCPAAPFSPYCLPSRRRHPAPPRSPPCSLSPGAPARASLLLSCRAPWPPLRPPILSAGVARSLGAFWAARAFSPALLMGLRLCVLWLLGARLACGLRAAAPALALHACFVARAPRVLGGWRSRARAAPCGCAGLPASGTRRPGPPPTPTGRRACVRRPPCMRGGPCFAACPPRFVVFWVCGFALGLGGGCVPRWRGPRGLAAGVAPYCALVAQLPCSPHAFVRRLCLLALLWPSLRPPLRAPLRRSSVVLCLGGPWAPGGPAAAG